VQNETGKDAPVVLLLRFLATQKMKVKKNACYLSLALFHSFTKYFFAKILAKPAFY